MIFVVYLGLYVIFVFGVLLCVAVRCGVAGRFTSGCRAALYGLLASAAGFVLPFLLFAAGGLLFYRHAPPQDANGDVGTWLLGCLVLLGPLVGPPAAFLGVMVWHTYRRP